MTEAEQRWLSCDDPGRMLRWLLEWEGRGDGGHNRHPAATDRRLRLFACACCRQVWDKLTDDVECPHLYTSKRKSCPSCGGTGRVNRSRRAVEVAERYADGEATAEELAAARGDAELAALANDIGHVVVAFVCRPDVNLWPLVGPRLDRALLASRAGLLRCLFGNPFRPACPLRAYDLGRGSPWLTPTVLGLARACYDGRDWAALGVLADALEEARCTDAALLGHLRGPGPHARGCWALDLLLAKS